jgi:hypothetical protein
VKTFVVRIFVPAQPDPQVTTKLHGLVDEVGTDRSVTFDGGEELLAVLRAAVEPRVRKAS